MPPLWNETIEAHRAAVRDAILDAAATLATESGPLSVTMREIAERTGIGRATLYKYFPDVESILVAWHQRHVARHLQELRSIAERSGAPLDRLAAALTAYAGIARRRPSSELAAALHRPEHVQEATRELTALFAELIDAGQRTGDLRADVAPAELAVYCLHALAAAPELASNAAVGRLVDVTLRGLQPVN